MIDRQLIQSSIDNLETVVTKIENLQEALRNDKSASPEKVGQLWEKKAQVKKAIRALKTV